MDAREILSQVRTIDVRLRNKLVEKQQWHDLAESITASMDGERVQSSGTQSKMADAVAVCVDLEADVFREVCNLRDIKLEAIRLIEGLRSTIQYDVLHMRYIQDIPLRLIAEKYGREYEWAKKTHRRALENVQENLDKK